MPSLESEFANPGLVRGPDSIDGLDSLAERYPDLPPLAKWKALITEHGVDFDNPLLFNSFAGIEAYKVKHRVLKPVADRLKVYDRSADTSLIPSEVTIHRGEAASIVKLGYRPGSPIQIDVDELGQVILRERSNQETIPLEVRLVKKRKYQDERVPAEIDSNTPKLSDFIDVIGLDRLSLITFDGCWNWNTGKPCRFCDFNPKRQGEPSGKPSLNVLGDFDKDVDAWWTHFRGPYLGGIQYTFDYLLRNEELSPHRHLLIMSGSLPEARKVWDIAFDAIATLNEVENIGNFDNYLNVCPHPDLAYLRSAKDLGVRQVQYNLEVIGAEAFAKFCPGKCDYQTFVAKLEEAVKVMGFGNVRSNFVLGLQPVEELLHGIEDLAAKGIVADYSIFQPKRATPLANHVSPSLDTIVYFTQELAKIYKKYNFKPIYCNLSSRSSIINECLQER